jgi:hypothetical protein
MALGIHAGMTASPQQFSFWVAAIFLTRHFGRDAEIVGLDGNWLVAQMLDSHAVTNLRLPSLDAGFRHPCRNDGISRLGWTS